MHCRLSSLILVCGLGISQFLFADEPHDMMAHVKVLQSIDVTTNVTEPTKTTTLSVEFAPGESHPPHRHPGPVYGYVIEGTLEFAIGDEPVRTLKAGDAFHEPKMILHRVGRNPDAKIPAKIVVVMIHPKDATQLVILEPANESTPAKGHEHDEHHGH